MLNTLLKPRRDSNCTQFPLKNRQFILADTYSPWKDNSQAAIWYWVRIGKHPPWSFHLVDLFLLLVSIINYTISFFFFHFHVFHVIFINIMVKNKELIFLAQGTHQYIIVAISLSWLVLVIGFNNNSINTVYFSIYLSFYEIFIKKWQKTRDCNFQHRAPVMEGCWTTSESSSFKFWRGSFGHRS